jgi:hypothetical protein
MAWSGKTVNIANSCASGEEECLAGLQSRSQKGNYLALFGAN